MTDWDNINKQICALLDRGHWRHTWHLPKNSGGLDLFDDKTLQRINQEVIFLRMEIRESEKLLKESIKARDLIDKSQYFKRCKKLG